MFRDTIIRDNPYQGHNKRNSVFRDTIIRDNPYLGHDKRNSVFRDTIIRQSVLKDTIRDTPYSGTR